jgi:capsular polysaccharide biosynthesis protein
MPPLEYRAYARVVLKRWLLIVVLAALAAGAAFAYAARAPRIYRATAQLSVTPSIVDYFTGEAIQRLLSNYSQVLRSKLFAAQYGPRLSPPASADALAGKVKAVAAPSEYRIAIEVDDPDPARAQQIANAAADAFVAKLRAENEGKEKRDVAVDVLERADAPGAPVSPRPKRDALGAAVLGAGIGVVTAFLLEFWDDSIKSAAEAAAVLQLPVLGTIPRRQTTDRGPKTDRARLAQRLPSFALRPSSLPKDR